MSNDTIYLDPDLFMALGLSAEAHGGIGWGGFNDGDHAPLCAVGHILDLGPRAISVPRPALALRSDESLGPHVPIGGRIPFAEWCQVVGVDVLATHPELAEGRPE